MATHSDMYYQEDHLRRLLDQRAARADLHGRFPSISEFSDSPSVYSHAHFSPRPIDRADQEPSTSSYHQYGRRPSLPQSLGITDRQRLDIPDASSLDLDDDTQPSYTPEPGSDSDEDNDDVVAGQTDDDAEVHRVSAYGPKMTVHSRAPWEIGEDDPVEFDEPDNVSKKSAFHFARKEKENAKKPRSRDGRPECDTRPSLDSMHSQSRGKQSFETTSSHVSAGGALLALAQASMSSTSLALSPSPQSSLRDKLSLPRFRSRTPSNNLQQRPDLSDFRPHHSNYSQSNVSRVQASSPVEPEFYRTDSRPSFSDPPSPRTPLNQQEYHHHPYANPDLVPNVPREAFPSQRLEELHSLAHPEPHSPGLPRSESTVTVTESGTLTSMSVMSQTRSNNSLLTPDSSTFSINRVQGEFSPTARSFAKGISAPIPLDTPQRSSYESNRPGTSQRDQGYQMPMAGWQESPHNNIKLISLEEAQAQARERSRSATANGTTASASPSPNSSRTMEGSTSQSAWTRMRSQSGSGPKMKSFASASTVDLHNMPPGPGEGKTVVRKKSGFMRLFNGKEKMPSSPPPVPSISVDILASPTPSTMPARTRKQSQHRVPVPSITPSVLAGSESGSSGRASDEDNTVTLPQSPPLRERQLSARRNVPGLSIVTNHTASGMSLKSPIEARTPLTAQTAVSEMSSNNPNFVAPLSIRPVSTMFGPEFAARISSPEPESSRPGLARDSGTPTTTASVISPRSPPIPYHLDRRPSDDKVVQVEDQSSVIQALQEQIVTARRAWQQQIWELEGQVRDLKAEVDELRAVEHDSEYCTSCGRGNTGKGVDHTEDLKKAGVKVGGVVNRPRARTGVGSRFGSAT
ncbi:hypothetical protein BDW22DRAFT_1424592 [Trametopsis cervina]|nr:hypothetical protein BDW22DRAFT_1424592 [Trametopsis cervina]